MLTHIECVAGSLFHAQDIVRRLHEAGIDHDALSYRLPNVSQPEVFDREFVGPAPNDEVLPPGGPKGMLSGPVGWAIGLGILGWLLGLWLVLLSGAEGSGDTGGLRGLLLPLFAACGGAVLGLVSAQIMARRERRRYRDKLRDGRILISAKIPEGPIREQAMSIFRQFGAVQIASHGS